MSNILLKTIRAATTITLIVGSIFVQHVARAQQSGKKPAEVHFSSGIGGEFATYLIESGKSLLTSVR